MEIMSNFITAGERVSEPCCNIINFSTFFFLKSFHDGKSSHLAVAEMQGNNMI